MTIVKNIVMGFLKSFIYISIPFSLLILFASILTTTPYLTVSKDLYDEHEDIYFDHSYVVDRLIGYLNYKYDDLLIGETESDTAYLFREIEMKHMVDVKNLYTVLRITAGISFLIAISIILYLKRKAPEELYNTLKNIYLGPLMFTLFVGGYILIDFNTAFTKFHEMFFSNDDWVLYSSDALIILLPTNFWMVSGLIILVLFSSSIALIVWLNHKFNKTLTK